MTNPPAAVEDADFTAALESRYLVYALSTITARSLPDVRDGLKPVHRRVLWAMRLLKLEPATAAKKCARIVGDVIGKYHPHGEQSVYDALVRLAQDFTVRYPLVDGQGNFGNVDGDNPAAQRYTEARLSLAAAELMAGLDEASVPFRETYNGEEEEPEVLPGGFPNLLANGAAGIAVGMATSIPPHNVAEIARAASVLLQDSEAPLDALLEHLAGPDFPTGGVVVEPAAAIREAYATGRGAFRLRARWEVEDTGRGTWVIVITEIPYQVIKGKLIADIAALIEEKRLPILADVRDESDSVIRLVIEPRSRNVEPAVLMESLFKLTDLETRYPLNLNVLDKHRTPRVMSLKEALAAWLDHQRDVLLARTRFRLGRIDDRLEILGGLLKAYLNLDEVIRIIRTADEPKGELIAAFELTDRQAEAILNMRLRTLNKLERLEIEREEKKLDREAAGLRRMLDTPREQVKRLAADLDTLEARYGPDTPLGRRRTTIAEAPEVTIIPLEAMIDREPLTVVLSAKGWIRALKGHVDLAAPELQKWKEGDGPALAFHAHTTDRLLLAADTGRFFTLAADRLPGGRGFGEPVRLMVDLPGEAAIVSLVAHRPGSKLLLVANDGRGFVASADELLAEMRKGRQVMNPRAGSKLAIVRPVGEGHDAIALTGDNRKLLVIALGEAPELARGQGVALQRYKDGGLADAITLARAAGLSWPLQGGRVRTEPDLTAWSGPRGSAGRLAPTGFPRDNRFV